MRSPDVLKWLYSSFSAVPLHTQLPQEARLQGFPYNCSEIEPGPRISVTSSSSLLLGILLTAPHVALQWSQEHAGEDGAILST